VIATAGHVDHGKSTLVEALTGIDPDRFEEEKRRGLTIDLGFAWLTLTSGLEVGIVDVPGHERFIRNMLAGVGAVDAVLFVVAADEGWMPQSAEHLQIVEFLGVERGVVALTKTDAAGELADEAEREVREHLAGTTLESAPIVRVSARTGDGLDELLAALARVLDDAPRPDEALRPRLWIDRSFSIKGAGTVVTGTLSGGPLRAGQEVRILPDGRSARIRSMQTHGDDVRLATGPRRLAVNLAGLDRRLVGRGDALVADDWICSNRFAARLSRDDFKERGAYELFVGTAQSRCRMRFLGGGYAEVFGDRPLPIVPGDRFVIRDVGRWRTIAGGVVLDQTPGKLRRGDTAALAARDGLAGDDLAERIVAERGFVDRDRLEALTGRRSRYEGARIIDARYAARVEETVLAALDKHHRDQPLSPGLALEKIDVPSEVVMELLPRWNVVYDKGLLRLPSHSDDLDDVDRASADRLLSALRAAGASPPEIRTMGVSQQLARALERRGELVFLTPATAYPADVWHDIEERIVHLISERGPCTLAQLRDAIGTTRKYAVPIAEKLDERGVTRRRGDVRELGPRGRELAGR
jgi:selenocysteine-specific elongation factor